MARPMALHMRRSFLSRWCDLVALQIRRTISNSVRSLDSFGEYRHFLSVRQQFAPANYKQAYTYLWLLQCCEVELAYRARSVSAHGAHAYVSVRSALGSRLILWWFHHQRQRYQRTRKSHVRPLTTCPNIHAMVCHTAQIPFSAFSFPCSTSPHPKPRHFSTLLSFWSCSWFRCKAEVGMCTSYRYF